MVTTTNKTKKKAQKMSTWDMIWRLVLCIVVPLGGGIGISLLTRDAMGQFGEFDQPPLAPPAWLFPVAWTILYTLMGVASYLIYMAGRRGNKAEKSTSMGLLVIYGVQLALNFAWSIMFFNWEWYWFAFAWLMVMWVMILVLVIISSKLSKAAMWCLLPYLLWCTFAAYLNLMIAILN